MWDAAHSTVLSPAGFRRRKLRWNRRVDDVVDVVAVIRSKSGESVDLMVGVCHPDLNKYLWGPDSDFVDDADCVVRVDLGELLGQESRIWRPADPTDVAELTQGLETVGLPWLARMHHPSSAIQFLESRPRMLVPSEAALFALLMYKTGHRAKACEMLTELRQRTWGAWATKVADVSAEIGCEPRPTSA